MSEQDYAGHTPHKLIEPGPLNTDPNAEMSVIEAFNMMMAKDPRMAKELGLDQLELTVITLQITDNNKAFRLVGSMLPGGVRHLRVEWELKTYREWVVAIVKVTLAGLSGRSDLINGL